MRHAMKRLDKALLTVILPLALNGGSTALTAQDAEVLATVAGHEITVADIEASLESQLAELEKQRLMLVESAIGPAIDRKLVEVEATALGITSNALLSTEVTAKIPPVTEADVDSWYEANRARLQPGTTQEQATGRIRDLLQQERGESLYRAYLGRLRAKHETKILFDPPRTEIDLADATWKGPENAPVTLVEFSDFQCPACRGFNPILDQLLTRYPNEVRVAFLQFPLRSIHPHAQGAAEAALCARDAGKFWELHDEMFADQRNLGIAGLKAAARKVGIDGEVFDACLDGNEYAPMVQADFSRAARAGVSGTPAVFVNGREVSPGRVPSFEALANLVEDELRRSPPADG